MLIVCGRYALYTLPEEVARRFGVALSAGLRPRYNIAPGQMIPLIRAAAENTAAVPRELRLVNWGLVPSWSNHPKDAGPINARSETAGSKPMFRDLLRRSRGVIPADGFYEWKRHEGRNKQPMFIRRRDRGMMSFAALWNECPPLPERSPMQSCVILTTAPNAMMQSIHDRMPAVLRPQHIESWLDPGTDAHAATELLRACGDDELEAIPVSNRVNSVRHDDPLCIEPQAPQSVIQPGLFG